MIWIVVQECLFLLIELEFRGFDGLGQILSDFGFGLGVLDLVEGIEWLVIILVFFIQYLFCLWIDSDSSDKEYRLCI